jgi:membrane associated rhomboid family serine protease
MLLLLPFDRELDWRRAPVVVIALVLVNALIYFVGQGDDDRKTREALEYYQESALPTLELNAYHALLARTEPTRAAELIEATQRDANGRITGYDNPWLPLELEFDPVFHQAVAEGRLIPEDAPAYAQWQAQRAEYEGMLGATVIHRYSLRPAIADPVTLISHMFLHGSAMHLIGNMVFLFIVGFVVEATLGSGLFLVVYLLAGLGSAGLDLLLQREDLIYHVGASGAISGIMGAYAAIFGMRRIHFFYNVLFWFDRVRGPAILMLPLWLANEGLQLLSDDGSNVNYLAHIGGLVAGAAIAGGLRLFTRQVDEEYLDQPEKEAAYAKGLQEALQLFGELQLVEARRALTRLGREYPERTEIFEYLFHASKPTPDSPDFHDSGRRLLLADDSSPGLRRQVFDDYTTLARPAPRLSTADALTAARHFLEEGDITAAEKLTAAALKREPRHPQLMPILKRLAQRAPAPRAEQYRRAIARLTTSAKA